MMDIITGHAYEVVILEAITERWQWERKFYRASTTRAAYWSDLRKANIVELRLLLKLARAARKMARSAPDPIDAYKAGRDRGMGYHDVQAWPDDGKVALDWKGELGA